jgi:molybdopterin-guanine dinucleotide biosynthesis protein A
VSSLIPDPRSLIPVTAIILCGGRSSRMGRDKGSLPFGGETMLDRIVRIVRAVAGHVIVVARRDQPAPSAVTLAYEVVEDLGPLAGIAAGLAASNSDLNVVVACDMPLIRPVVLARLVSLIDDYDACVAVANGQASPLCGIYRSRIAPDAQALLDSGERRLMRLLDVVRTKRVDAAVFRDIDPNLETFMSVDTPEKYSLAQSLIPNS